MELLEYLENYKSMAKKDMTSCFNSFSIEDRQNFLELLSEECKKDFIKDIRNQAVKDFWTHEQELIKMV
ncbi:MAG: hypothetical protein II919_04025 [Lachnospiraceae bacterium]|nr:hypothetical protein [Lachnospiraceae bacterium]